MSESSQLGAIHYGAMIAIIIAITTMIVLIPFINKSATTAGTTLERSECALSVRQHAFAQTAGVESFAHDLKCPASEVRITSQPSDEETKTAAFRTVGDAMLACWDDFGEGKLRLFDKEGVYCNICSFVDFDVQLKKSKKTFLGLNEFLAKNKPPGSRDTYLEVLSGTKTERFAEFFDDPANLQAKTDLTNSLSTDKLYSTIFVYARGEDAMGNLKDYFGGRDAVLGYGVGGSAALGLGVGAVVLLTGPPGWMAALAAAGTVGGGIFAAGGGLSVYNYLQDNPPQWLALTSFGEHDSTRLQRLGCQETRLTVRENP